MSRIKHIIYIVILLQLIKKTPNRYTYTTIKRREQPLSYC